MSPGGKSTKTGSFWEQVIKPVLEIHYAGKYKTRQSWDTGYLAALQACFIIVSAK